MSDLSAIPGFRADASSPQAVSTKGFNPGRNYALEYRQRKQRDDQVAEICREIEERT
jgi:hypothetical protein